MNVFKKYYEAFLLLKKEIKQEHETILVVTEDNELNKHLPKINQWIMGQPLQCATK